jgi:hypothetical protein
MIISLALITVSTFLAGKATVGAVDLLLGELEELPRRSSHYIGGHTFVATNQGEYRALKSLLAVTRQVAGEIVASGAVNECQKDALAAVVLDGVVEWACRGTSVGWGLSQREGIPSEVFAQLYLAWERVDAPMKAQAFLGARLCSEPPCDGRK